MGYAGEAMNELHGTDVFTEDQRVADVVQETNWRREMERRGQAIDTAMGRYRSTEPLIEAVRRLSNDFHAAKILIDGSPVGEIVRELANARAAHAPMNGHHEGYAVILEELDELWEACKVNTHKRSIANIEQARIDKRAAMRKEALQVATMAIRFIEDVCDKV